MFGIWRHPSDQAEPVAGTASAGSEGVPACRVTTHVIKISVAGEDACAPSTVGPSISQASIQSDYHDFTLTASERRPTLNSPVSLRKVRIFPDGARGISLAKYSSPVPA